MSNSNSVVKLVPRSAIKSEGCVAALENMLELARSGELVGVAVAGVDPKGCTRTCFEAGENVGTLIGAVARVQHRLLEYQADD